jgi:hypothetical protein
MKNQAGSRLTLKKVAKVARYAIFQDSYGGGYCLYNNISFDSLQEVWDSECKTNR